MKPPLSPGARRWLTVAIQTSTAVAGRRRYAYSWIPRHSVIRFYRSKGSIQLGQGKSRRNYWLAVQYRLNNGKDVSLLLHEIGVSDTTAQTTQARNTIAQWENGYNDWLTTGTTNFFPQLYKATQKT